MVNLRSAIENTVPITLFNRGQAGKIFEEVRRDGPKVVIKNNAPECVLISPEDYVKLIDELEDAKLLAIATERMAHFDPDKLISQEEIDREFGFTEDDLADIDVDIE
ncbi:MAG: type II toxin-antitoxin system Phd/YefM family antitoxin [Oscillospiraceae bacterium]|nr:type II toxin-antitoxin system Phd/YefM family antitoxin [Oscillospiraceae bacterium]